MTAAPHLLALCGSMKPAPGDQRPSACRSILRAATGLVSSVFPHIEMLDIREAALPPFQGLAPGDHPDPRVMDCHARIRAASGLILSVPAYWGGVGGAFKSFVETVSGPAYDTGAASPFAAPSITNSLSRMGSPFAWSGPVACTNSVAVVVAVVVL